MDFLFQPIPVMLDLPASAPDHVYSSDVTRQELVARQVLAQQNALPAQVALYLALGLTDGLAACRGWSRQKDR